MLTVKKIFLFNRFTAPIRKKKKWQADWVPEEVCTLRIKEKKLFCPCLESKYNSSDVQTVTWSLHRHTQVRLHTYTSLIRTSGYSHVTVSSFRHSGSRNSVTKRYPLSSLSQHVRHLLCHCSTKFIAWWQLQLLRLE